MVTADPVLFGAYDRQDFADRLIQLVIDHQVVVVADILYLIFGNSQSLFDLRHGIRPAVDEPVPQDLHGRRDDEYLDIGDLGGADLSRTLDVYIHDHMLVLLKLALDIADRGAIPVTEDPRMLQEVLVVYPPDEFILIDEVIMDPVLFDTPRRAGRKGYGIFNIVRDAQDLVQDSAFATT